MLRIIHNRTIYCHDTTLFYSPRGRRLASLMLTSVTFKYSALSLTLAQTKPTQSDEIYVLTKKNTYHIEGGLRKLPAHKGLTKLTKNSKSHRLRKRGREMPEPACTCNLAWSCLSKRRHKRIRFLFFFFEFLSVFSDQGCCLFLRTVCICVTIKYFPSCCCCYCRRFLCAIRHYPSLSLLPFHCQTPLCHNTSALWQVQNLRVLSA